MFPIELWNAYDRTIMNLPRSNNSIEGWHNAFAKRVAIVHPSVTKLAEKIRREQSKFEMDIAQIRQGQEPKPKKVQYQKLDERTKRLVDDFQRQTWRVFKWTSYKYVFVIFCSFFVYFFFIYFCCIESIFLSTKFLFQSFSIN